MHRFAHIKLIRLGLCLAVGAAAAAGCTPKTPPKVVTAPPPESTSQSGPGTTPPPVPGAPPGKAPQIGLNSDDTSPPGGPKARKLQADVNKTATVELPGKTSGPDVDAVRTIIQGQYVKQNKAIRKEDTKAAMSIYDVDWGKVHINGRKSQMGRQKFYFSRLFARLKKLHAETTIRQLSLDGDMAYVVARQHWAGRAYSGPLKKEVWTYVDFIVKDEWEKQPSGEWLMIATTNLRRVKYAPDHQVKVNGKTLPEKAPSDDTPAPAPSDADIDAVT